MKFTISGNPVSSKNSRPIFINKTTGSRFIGKSKTLKDYMDRGLMELHSEVIRAGRFTNNKAIGFVYDNKSSITTIPITSDIEITFTFYVKDNRRRDLVNLCQAPLDLLQKAEIISDDSIVKSLDGSRIYIDKENARTEIELKIIKEAENDL